MTLREAVEYYRRQERAISNSCEWYRKSAKSSGEIAIGGVSVAVYRVKGRWHVDEKTFHKAIQEHLVQISHVKKVTEDYSKGIIHGRDGDTVHTVWGGYRIHGVFRLVWSDLESRRMKSYGTWCCNRCNSRAETEHSKEECHLCKDWNGGGTDCPLSRREEAQARRCRVH